MAKEPALSDIVEDLVNRARYHFEKANSSKHAAVERHHKEAQNAYDSSADWYQRGDEDRGQNYLQQGSKAAAAAESLEKAHSTYGGGYEMHQLGAGKEYGGK